MKINPIDVVNSTKKEWIKLCKDVISLFPRNGNTLGYYYQYGHEDWFFYCDCFLQSVKELSYLLKEDKEDLLAIARMKKQVNEDIKDLNELIKKSVCRDDNLNGIIKCFLSSKRKPRKSTKKVSSKPKTTVKKVSTKVKSTVKPKAKRVVKAKPRIKKVVVKNPIVVYSPVKVNEDVVLADVIYVRPTVRNNIVVYVDSQVNKEVVKVESVVKNAVIPYIDSDVEYAYLIDTLNKYLPEWKEIRELAERRMEMLKNGKRTNQAFEEYTLLKNRIQELTFYIDDYYKDIERIKKYRYFRRLIKDIQTEWFGWWGGAHLDRVTTYRRIITERNKLRKLLR